MPIFPFLLGFDKDTQSSLLNQIRDLWTHASTSLEGNTLSLNDTKFIIEEGFAVSSKLLKDHQEVVGHARTIDILYDLIHEEVTEQSLFALHNAVQTEAISDIYKPQDAWENEPNGTYSIDKSNQKIFINYASPVETPELMKDWLTELKTISKQSLSVEEAVKRTVGYI